MNWKCVFGNVIVLSLLSIEIFAQSENDSYVPSSNLSITCNKTTNLIFPFTVQSIDRGSKDILVQQPKGTENIVQVKADKPNFTQTNLSVITNNGKLYSFTVDYAAQPSQLNIIVEDKSYGHAGSASDNIKLTSGNNAARYKSIAQKIETTKAVHGERIWLDKIQLRVGGIYVNDDVIYFRLLVRNNSNISYEIDNIRFSINAKQKSRRTATQEIELEPVYTNNNLNKVEPDSLYSEIIAIPKFTLAGSKYLSIQLFEKNGSRNLSMVLKGHHLENATAISE